MKANKILIIEHNEKIAEVMQEKLQLLDYDSKILESEEVSVEGVVESAPDVIILDIMMPGMDALKFLNKLRNDSRTSSIPVIITSLVSDKVKEDSLKLGAIDFFRKPLDFSALDERIKKISNKKTILILDDDPDILFLLETRMTAMGYNVITSSNGQQALEKARQDKPDIIMVDIVLPDMDGLEVVSRLKNEESGVSDIPVIAFTGKVALSGMEEVLGIDKFVGKNFSPDDLVAEVEEFLKSR